MKCPSCGALQEAPADRCPACKLTLQKLDLKFGLLPRHSRYLSDRTGTLAMNEMAELRDALRLFEKRFPQSLFSAFVTELPHGSSVAEYAFWLANRARFSSVEKRHADNFDLLLVVDLTSNAAALTAGYGLEKYVSEDDLQDALDALVEPLRRGDLAGGIRACLDALARRLRAIAMQTEELQDEPPVPATNEA